MRDELRMRYRKIKASAVHANSDRNRVLRQQAALKLLEALADKKVLLNVDETWLGLSDFRRRKWRAHGTSNSVRTMQLAPRLSLIIGVDTLGGVYAMLTQANSNAALMRVYFASLCRRLDQERPGWRGDTVVLLDNAPYHCGASTLRVLQQLRVPVAFFGPHSYDAAPAELFFAWFKSTDINPGHVATGKR